MQEAHETADAIDRVKSILICCDDLDGHPEIAADLEHVRSTATVMLGDYETEWVIAGVEDFMLIERMNDLLLKLDVQRRTLD